MIREDRMTPELINAVGESRKESVNELAERYGVTRDEILEAQERWWKSRPKTPDTVILDRRERQREASRRYVEKNKEKIRAYNREYARKNREKISKQKKLAYQRRKEAKAYEQS